MEHCMLAPRPISRKGFGNIGRDWAANSPANIILNVSFFAETHATIQDAVTREHRIKKWKRAWKIELIESQNSDWHDLYEDVCL